MATNAYITAKIADQHATIYIHSDGYPAHTGSILARCYNTDEKVRGIISLGDLSSLRETLTASVFYGRDRGEEGTGASWSPATAGMPVDIDNECGMYRYYWDGSAWWTKEGGEWTHTLTQEPSNTGSGQHEHR